MKANTFYIEAILCYLIYLNTGTGFWLFVCFVLLGFGAVETILNLIIALLKALMED